MVSDILTLIHRRPFKVRKNVNLLLRRLLLNWYYISLLSGRRGCWGWERVSTYNLHREHL